MNESTKMTYEDLKAGLKNSRKTAVSQRGGSDNAPVGKRPVDYLQRKNISPSLFPS